MRRLVLLAVALLLVGCATSAPRTDAVLVDRLAFGLGLERTDSLVASLVRLSCKEQGSDCNEAKRNQRSWRATYNAGMKALTTPPPEGKPQTFDLAPILDALTPFIKFAIDAAL